MLVEIVSKDKRFKIRHVVTCACGCGEIIEDANRNGVIKYKKLHYNKTKEAREIVSHNSKKRINFRHTDKSKKLISDKRKGVKQSPETIAKVKAKRDAYWTKTENHEAIAEHSRQMWANREIRKK